MTIDDVHAADGPTLADAGADEVTVEVCSAPSPVAPGPGGEPLLELEVSARELLCDNVLALTLTAPRGELPAWTPGAHVDLLLPGGLTRQYSLCGSPDDRRNWRIGVLREPAGRGGSAYVHDTLQVGDPVTVAGPRNHFELLTADRYVFLAGGIGVTPLLPMAALAAARGANVRFVYCVRSASAAAYRDELRRRLGDRVQVHVDDESGIFDLAGYLRDPRAETLVYACGPSPFLDAVTAATAAWPARTVHMERFTPLDARDAVDTAFEVELAASGKVLDVPPGTSILQVLRENDVQVLSSCTEGTCGTCEVPVLAGEVDHRDVVLSPEEQASGEMMMVCVSRCRGRRLVLDV